MKTEIETHIASARTIYGVTESHYRPLMLRRQISLFNELKKSTGGYVDCENVFFALMNYMAGCRGRRVKCTQAQRTIFLQLYTRRHQYQKGDPVAFPTVLAGYRHKDAVKELRTALEETGLIRQVSGAWAYNPIERKYNRAPKYEFHPHFAALLDIIHMSVMKGRTTGRYCLDDSPSASRTIFAYFSKKTKKCMNGVLREAPSLANNAFTPTNVEKLMEQKDRIKRDRKVSRLWGGMSASEAKETAIADKCRLQSHSVCIGAECDDITITRLCEERYHVDKYAVLANHVDGHMPAIMADPTTGQPISLHHSCHFNIKRDKEGNVSSIGCRPVSGLCQTLNEEHEAFAAGNQIPRTPVMDALHLDHHFDVRCSIYNLAVALNTGKFENKDYYSAIAARLHVTRGEAKIALMHANFGIFAEQCARHPDGKKAASYVRHKDPDSGKVTVFPFTYREVQDAMRAEGLPIQGRYTEIFMHEAFVYDLVRKYLLDEEHVPSARIYDSFYTRLYVGEKEYIRLINRAVGEYLSIIA